MGETYQCDGDSEFPRAHGGIVGDLSKVFR
jgi:hypothetical protein